MPKQYKFKFNKLVRDKIPSILQLKGIQLCDRIIGDNEYIKELKNKLLEEVKEVINAHNNEEICEELADIFEVILAIGEVYQVTLDDIKRIAEQKKSKNGGFDKKIYIEHIEIDGNNPKLEYFISNKYEMID